jgi:hypothetical protein
MTNDNKISASIPAQDMTDIMAAFATIKAKLPFLINLSAEEKRRMPNIGTERGGMVETFTIEMDLHADLIPTFVDMPELALDGALFSQLDIIKACANELCEGINDTHQAVGSDMYLAYLSFYNNVKQAAKRAVVGCRCDLPKPAPLLPARWQHTAAHPADPLNPALWGAGPHRPATRRMGG